MTSPTGTKADVLSRSLSTTYGNYAYSYYESFSKISKSMTHLPGISAHKVKAKMTLQQQQRTEKSKLQTVATLLG